MMWYETLILLIMIYAGGFIYSSVRTSIKKVNSFPGNKTIAPQALEYKPNILLLAWILLVPYLATLDSGSIYFVTRLVAVHIFHLIVGLIGYSFADCKRYWVFLVLFIAY